MATALDFSDAEWRTSTYTGSNGGGGDTCVEIARPNSAWVGIRDSKCPEGGMLVIPADSFERLLSGIARGVVGCS